MITTITPSYEYEEHLYCSYTDYQGSLIALTDENGTVVERYAYDPWGARRNPDNWTLSATPPSGGWGAMLVNRGYTGHEHLDAFGIINMNGRVYDPLTAMFFSPDPVLTDAGNWLDYNRYGYCLGNPFSYTDPSGYNWLTRNMNTIFTTALTIGVGIGVGILTGGMGLVASGMLTGMAAGGVGGAVGTALQGGSFSDAMGAGVKGMVIGGATGALTGGFGKVGDVFGHAAKDIGTELLRAGAHGVLNGSINAINGGNFLDGFAVGAVSSLVGSGLQAAGVGRTLGILSCGLAGAGTAAILGGDLFLVGVL